MSVDQVAESRKPARVLVDYLQQTAADPAVCDVNRRDGPALALVSKDLVRGLGRAFDDGTLTPDRWLACTLRLWEGPSAVAEDALAAGLVDALATHVLSAELSTDRRVRARAAAVLAVLEQRVSSTPLDVGVVEDLVRRASRRRADATGEAADLLDATIAHLELEGGLHDGRRVDATLVQATIDEALLGTWALRLPDAALREQAGQRLLGLRLTGLPERWRVDAEASVLAHGYFAIPEGSTVRHARWEPRPEDPAMLRLLQNPARGWVRLLPAARDATRAADPTVELRGALRIDVDGLDEAITLCPPRDAWDPTPCFPTERLAMTHPIAELMPTGRLRFPEELALDDVLRLGSDGDRLAAQVLVDGVIAAIDLPIQFDSVPGHEFSGDQTLTVEVWELSHERLLIEVQTPLGLRRQLVPQSDAQFGIRGRLSDAGGTANLKVRMRCTNCEAVTATLERMITSETGTVSIKRVRD